MQTQVAKDMGVPSFDFGEIWEGWQPFQQMVHPEKVSWGRPAIGRAFSEPAADLGVGVCVAQWPGGPVYAQALIHHIYMEHVGRESWRLSHQRKLAPLETKAQVELDNLGGVLA